MLTPSKINLFTFFNLPSAWWSGVRVTAINKEQCTTRVKHRWFTKNPFKSLYFAVQAMAAELSTGALVMSYIKQQDAKVSMLVARNEAVFTKKATGKISFNCSDGVAVKHAIEQTIETGEGQTIWMKSIGTNSDGVVVSEFKFEWTLKKKSI